MLGQVLISQATLSSSIVSRPIPLLGWWKIGVRCYYVVNTLLLRATLTGCHTLSVHCGILQRSDTSLATSRADSQSFVWNTLFLTSCDAIEFSEMGQGRWVFLDLPVKLLMVFYASRLECMKLMVLTTSNQRSLCFLSIWESKSDAALFYFSPEGALRKSW